MSDKSTGSPAEQSPALAAFTPPARGLIVAGAFALVVLLMESTASVLAPLLLAAFITVISAPGLRWMRSKGIPKWIALAVVVFLLLDIGSLVALLATGALEGFRESLPTYQERFMLLNQELGGWLEAAGLSNSADAIPDLLDPSQVSRAVSLILSNAGGIFATGFLVLLASVFMLLETPGLPAKLRAAFDLSPAGEARIARLTNAVIGYMRIKTLTSLGTAICVWALLRWMGVDFAVLWALLAFFFNFIPVIGNILMMIPAVLLALVQAGLGTAAAVAAGYLVINTVIGNVLEPRIMGKGLGVSTLAVFVSLLFWGWLFGTVGMFLAVPLTVAVVIALDASPHTRPLAIMLGPDIRGIDSKGGIRDDASQEKPSPPGSDSTR
jgi:predicted PurR-regulated permease PerM